jgi:hypothetical protein
MKDSPEKISPLRRRMIEDMRMRKPSTKTQESYIRAVRHFAGFLGRAHRLSIRPAQVSTLREHLRSLAPGSSPRCGASCCTCQPPAFTAMTGRSSPETSALRPHSFVGLTPRSVGNISRDSTPNARARNLTSDDHRSRKSAAYGSSGHRNTAAHRHHASTSRYSDL